MTPTSSWYFYDGLVGGKLAEIIRGLRDDEGLSWHRCTIELDKRHGITVSEPLIKKFYRQRVAAEV